MKRARESRFILSILVSVLHIKISKVEQSGELLLRKIALTMMITATALMSLGPSLERGGVSPSTHNSSPSRSSTPLLQELQTTSLQVSNG